jgi:hypothetical protein
MPLLEFVVASPSVSHQASDKTNLKNRTLKVWRDKAGQTIRAGARQASRSPRPGTGRK